MNIAAILYEGDQGSTVDALLADVAYHLRERGWKLAGAVQALGVPRNSRCEMTLEDLATGARIETADGDIHIHAHGTQRVDRLRRAIEAFAAEMQREPIEHKEAAE